MDVIQVQNEPSSATCPHCGAEVALDQRYCLACGRPCSPVRLAFLDVLQAESAQQAPGTALTAANGYVPPAAPPDPGIARLTRYSGLFSLLAVLLLTGVIGLLIGHWVSGGGNGSNKPTVYKIEGLSTSGGTAGSSEEATGSAGEATSEGKAAATGKSEAKAPSSQAPKAKEAKQQEAEAEKTSKEKLPEAKKQSKSSLEKLKKLSGKAYEKEIEKETESGAPLET